MILPVLNKLHIFYMFMKACMQFSSSISYSVNLCMDQWILGLNLTPYSLIFFFKKNSFVQFLDIFFQKLHLHNFWTPIVEYGNFKIATATKFHYHLLLSWINIEVSHTTLKVKDIKWERQRWGGAVHMTYDLLLSPQLHVLHQKSMLSTSLIIAHNSDNT